MLFSLIKASGHSMSPVIKDGDFFIVSDFYYKLRDFSIGDIIIFKVDNKLIVKKIYKIQNDLIYVVGENKNDSKNFQPINRNEVLGKVIWIF